MNTFGQHLLVEYFGCNNAVLNDATRIESVMRVAAEAALATVVATTFHRFSPQGVSGVLVIEESHLSIHTWPECGYAAVDFYTCGECRPERAYEVLRRELGAERAEVMTVHRGVPRSGSPSMHRPAGRLAPGRPSPESSAPGRSMQVKRHDHWERARSAQRSIGSAALGVMSWPES